MTTPFADWPFRRIDYIFLRCTVHAGSSLEDRGLPPRFDMPENGVWASDHFGLVADLRAH